MDLESLRCFVAVYETLHFRLASERVALSAAALSERIRRLEEDIGAPLFERSTRRVLPTDAGRRLLPHARLLLHEAGRASAVARGDQSPLPFSLTVGTRFELGLSWLCPALDPLQQARPHRTLHLAMADTASLLDRLERGTLDAAVLSARITRPNIQSAVLHEEAYAFVSAAHGPTGPEEAGAFTLVDASPDLPLFHYLLDAGQGEALWRFGGYLYLGGIGAMRQRILSGAGVGVLPRYFIEADLYQGRLRELNPKIRINSDYFRLLWRADHPAEAELVQLAAELRELPLR